MNTTLKQFAEDAGVTIVLCGPGWGGKYGYKTKDHPYSTHNGYKTKREAYEAWAIDTFGNRAGVALVRLLTPNTGVKGRRPDAPDETGNAPASP